MTDKKKPFHLQVAEKFIQQLEEGTAPWQRPWQPGTMQLPHNPTTGKRYNGVNLLHLATQGFSDPRWLTYKQASAQGWQVQRGEKGSMGAVLEVP